MSDLEKYIEDHILTSISEHYGGRYKVERGRGDRIMVDDKVIKGVLFMPPRKKDYATVQEHIDFVIDLIGEDIKRGRFIGLTEE